MRYRIKRLLGLVLVLVLGISMIVYADEEEIPSVTIEIPICFSNAVSDGFDATVTIRDRESGEVLKTITRKEIANMGGRYGFSLHYNEPGNHRYSIVSVSEFGEESCYADVAVMSDDDGNLSAIFVLYWKDSSTKIETIEFGHNVPQPVRPSKNVILGVKSKSWYVPMVVMAAGILLAFLAVVQKYKTRKGSK